MVARAWFRVYRGGRGGLGEGEGVGGFGFEWDVWGVFDFLFRRRLQRGRWLRGRWYWREGESACALLAWEERLIRTKGRFRTSE